MNSFAIVGARLFFILYRHMLPIYPLIYVDMFCFLNTYICTHAPLILMKKESPNMTVNFIRAFLEPDPKKYLVHVFGIHFDFGLFSGQLLFF